MNRRDALRRFLAFAAASPLSAQKSAQTPIEDLNTPVNVHEFEAIAKRKLDPLAYDFIAGGVEDERTLRANIEAYSRVFLVPRVMVDVSTVDTSLDLLGIHLEQPILIAPTGGKELVMPNAEVTVAKAARATRTLMCSATGVERPLLNAPDFHWWTNTIGQATRELAVAYARRVEDKGAKGIVVTVDNPYQSDRDRNNRNRFDYDYMRSGIPKPSDRGKAIEPAIAGMWQPHTPNMTWDYLGWLRTATKLPVLLKGILAPEDARIAVDRGASAIIVSNHGGRQLDGAIATLDALPGVIEAVAGKIPVLMDGGIRRGSDILKALALGAKAILVGRAPLWGLGAFGQPGVERVLWMLGAELKLDMAMAGKPNLAAIDRTLVRRS
jgi:isopentenyl diphosphate isomerase/L-lactate dehydrogenase-like FMN-dependent dehydrogenase